MAEMKTQFQSRSRGEMESEWKIASNLSGGNFLFVLSEQWQILSWPWSWWRSEEIGRRSGPTLAHQNSDHCSSTSGHTMAAVDQSGTAFIQ